MTFSQADSFQTAQTIARTKQPEISSQSRDIDAGEALKLVRQGPGEAA